MATTDILLHEILPKFDVSAEYSIWVYSTPDRIFRVLQQGVPSGAITKMLMALRNMPRWFLKDHDAPTAENSFYTLKQLENREVVIGIIGQFWKPISNPLPVHSLDEFLQFERDGYCKAALNLRIIQKAPYQCQVTTETRVLCYGSARQHFNEYWRVIAPCSGLIRKEILRKIKKRAEKHQR